jgi:hypothetical protein
MWGAPSSAGWRHSATTWSQWSGTSRPQAGAYHLESPFALRITRMPLLSTSSTPPPAIRGIFRRAPDRILPVFFVYIPIVFERGPCGRSSGTSPRTADSPETLTP